MNINTVPIPEPTPGPVPAPPLAPKGARPVRTGTIVGGVLVLIICAIVTQQMLAPETVDLTTWVTVVVLGLGVILLGAGVAAVVRQSRRSEQ